MNLLSLFRKKAPKRTEGIRLAMVLLRSNTLPAADAVVHSLNEHDPDAKASLESSENGTIQLRYRGLDAIIAHMPVAIPLDELEGPSRTSLSAPDPDEVASHATHAIVTVFAPGAPASSACLALTAVLAALARQPEAVAVYWGAGPNLLSAGGFLELADFASEEALPVLLWIAVHRLPADEGARTIATQGMSQFGVPELEIVNTREAGRRVLEVLDFVGGYLITNGPVLADGHTIGRSEEERIQVLHRPSVMDRKETVLQLQL